MFIGHWAVALTAATHRKAPTLGMLFIAAQLVDWAFFVFLLTGTEQMRLVPGITKMNPMDLYHMPYTHSLLGSAGFALGFAAVLWLATRNRTAALIGGAVVLSHWFLDLLVHVPDLTLAGSPPQLGFGLWNYPAIEMPLELAMIFGALWSYARTARPSPLRLAVLGLVMLALQAYNWFAPPATRIDAGTSLMALAAYALGTLAAWWMGKSVSPHAQSL